MTGLCLYKPSFEENFGSICRAAYNFNVDFICTIENKYKRQPPDTVNVKNNLPVFHFKNIGAFLESRPKECFLISLEITPKSLNLETFSHPKNAIYIFGGEKGANAIPEELLNKTTTLKINSNRCLNLAMCAGIVLFHRHLQFFKK